jgi:hypothetical protein
MRVKPWGRDAIQSHFIALLLVVLLIVVCSVRCPQRMLLAGCSRCIIRWGQRTLQQLVKGHIFSGTSRAARASVCNQPMKQAGGFEDSTEFQLMHAPTTPAPE